jgi:hypothetical protein
MKIQFQWRTLFGLLMLFAASPRALSQDAGQSTSLPAHIVIDIVGTATVTRVGWMTDVSEPLEIGMEIFDSDVIDVTYDLTSQVTLLCADAIHTDVIIVERRTSTCTLPPPSPESVRGSAPDVPYLIDPVGTVLTIPTTVYWSPITGAFFYDVTISPQNEAPIINQADLTQPLLDLGQPNLLVAGTTYYVQVIAKNSSKTQLGEVSNNRFTVMLPEDAQTIEDRINATPFPPNMDDQHRAIIKTYLYASQNLTIDAINSLSTAWNINIITHPVVDPLVPQQIYMRLGTLYSNLEFDNEAIAAYRLAIQAQLGVRTEWVAVAHYELARLLRGTHEDWGWCHADEAVTQYTSIMDQTAIQLQDARQLRKDISKKLGGADPDCGNLAGYH